MTLAITRDVSPTLPRCELEHLPRAPIDVDRAREQHRRYEECLSELGCEILRLPAEAELPDSVFVEDTAVVLDELAILTRPGALSRRGEIPSIAHAIAPYRRLVSIDPPATLDGGDVLRIGQTLYVGISRRTNGEGLDQMRTLAEPYGYTVLGVPIRGCLHLKSAVTQVAEGAVLLHPGWVAPATFDSLERIEIDPSEPHAANALLVGDTVVYPAAFPATRRRLEKRGVRVAEVDLSELAKAEGGVTCCSLILRAYDP